MFVCLNLLFVFLGQLLIVIGEAYTFIANNWNPGDEIFLIGFSRGAFTARSIGRYSPSLPAAVPQLMFSSSRWRDM